jgi:hypothetical protein
VASYLIRIPDYTLLVDPLVEQPGDAVLEALDRLLTGQVRILITVPYHTRSAEFLCRRYRGLGAEILGHPLVAKRMKEPSALRTVSPGDALEGLVRFHSIGRPVRAEMPIEIPSLKALLFGDSIVEFGGELHLWEPPIKGERRRRWYCEKLLPSLQALTQVNPELILVTHGRPVLEQGKAALEEALSRGPWQRPS